MDEGRERQISEEDRAVGRAGRQVFRIQDFPFSNLQVGY
jgi:hypothetical protein